MITIAKVIRSILIFLISAVVEITNPNYKINFNVENSIGVTLGFKNKVLSFGYNRSSGKVDIMSVNSILINVDLVHGSYVIGVKGHAIHSFFPNVKPGSKICLMPTSKFIFRPINSHYITHVRGWLTDQDGKLLDFQGERIQLRIVIKEKIDKRTVKREF